MRAINSIKLVLSFAILGVATTLVANPFIFTSSAKKAAPARTRQTASGASRADKSDTAAVVALQKAIESGAFFEMSGTPVPTPTLGNYPNTMVVVGANTTVTPDAAPTGATSINVATDSNFKGTFVANPITGVVRVTNAHPAGSYTVTVKAFDAGGMGLRPRESCGALFLPEAGREVARLIRAGPAPALKSSPFLTP
ncbi:MAG: hypothetical protein LC776_14740 [Acidobacteria bacterium]|nr:hypothetical protein [Acidobacteriota bacterium]